MEEAVKTVGGKLAVKKKGGNFVKGALILGIGGFIGKLLGAVYRIPLTNIIGAEGMGLYQMIFPMYALLLTISSSGIPTALSRLIAERVAKGEHARGASLWRTSLITLLFLGTLCGLAIFFFGGWIASAQGNAEAGLAYKGIAPSLIFVAVISSLRGYFQGRQNMIPSSMSQIIEQVVKMAAGIILAVLFLPRGIAWAAFGATVGVSISEFAAMVVLLIQYMASKDKLPLSRTARTFWSDVKNIYALSIPITLGGIILPLTQLIDSALVINLLTAGGASTSAATSLFGLSSGPVGSLINMPVVLSLAIATAIVPAISSSNAVGDSKNVHRKAGLALKLTMLVALPSFIVLCLFARPIIDLLYSGGLKVGEVNEPLIAGQLLAISSLGVLFIAFIQVMTSIMHALNHTIRPVINLLVGAVVKVVLNLLLIPRIGIYGVAVASTACYFVAMILDIISLALVTKVKLKVRQFALSPLLAAACMTAIGLLLYYTLDGLTGGKIALLISLVIAGCAYLLLLPVFGAFDADEISGIPLIGRFMIIRKK